MLRKVLLVVMLYTDKKQIICLDNNMKYSSSTDISF